MTMSEIPQTTIGDRLVRSYQRNFPLVPEPFSQIARELSVTDADVIAAYSALIANGTLARIGGVVRPNTVAASTLAAVSVPELSTDAVAAMISDLEGVNHVYLRENQVNIWFVATGPDRAFVDQTLANVEKLAARPVLNLRLERAFHIDLGFDLDGGAKTHDAIQKPHDQYRSMAKDRDILQVLTSGLPLASRPYQRVGAALGLVEGDVIRRLKHMLDAGVITRIGAIVRHRAIGWRSNAMVVWDIPDDDVERAATRLAEFPGINLCYQRTRYAEAWPYNLYCMIHAKTRTEALETLHKATQAAGIENYPSQVLFSQRCYKQTGALIVSPKVAA